MHYYKFNIADWNLATAHLSLEEEAIYFRLVNYYYDTESPIPLETQSVFRRLRLGSHSDTALAILGEFFDLTDDGWAHRRCEKDLKAYKKNSRKNKKNGANGGRPRKDAASSETQTKPNGLPNESETKGNHKPLTTNHKPLTTNQEGENTPPPPQKNYVTNFAMTLGWEPDKNFWEGNCQRSGVNPDYSGVIQEFRLYWSGESRKLTETQWQGKLISEIKRQYQKTKYIRGNGSDNSQGMTPEQRAELVKQFSN